MPIKKAPFQIRPTNKENGYFDSVWERWFDYAARTIITAHDELEEDSLNWDESSHTKGNAAKSSPTGDDEIAGFDSESSDTPVTFKLSKLAAEEQTFAIGNFTGPAGDGSYSLDVTHKRGHQFVSVVLYEGTTLVGTPDVNATSTTQFTLTIGGSFAGNLTVSII